MHWSPRHLWFVDCWGRCRARNCDHFGRVCSRNVICATQIKSSNHFYCHITTAQVPWWVKFLWACSRQCKKNNKLFTYGQTVQKKLHWSIYSAPDSAKKTTTTIYIWTDSAKKTTNNLHMDRQCKKNNNNLHMDSTYLQTVQKTMCKIHIHIHILSTHSVL